MVSPVSNTLADSRYSTDMQALHHSLTLSLAPTVTGLSMTIQIIGALAKAISWLPLSINRALGAWIGQVAWSLNSRARRITEINLQLCFPDLSEEERLTLARKSVLETGRQLTESAWIFHRPIEQTLARIHPGQGQDLMTEARASAKGLIMISPHMGNWELPTLPLSQGAPFTYFYRNPRKSGMGGLLLKWRSHLGGQPATLEAAGIRRGMKVLKQGGTLGILPDQEPDRNNGVYAPMFGEPALTMTLLAKLAHKNNAHLLFCVAERLPGADGWAMHYLPADDRMASTDLVEATAALNEGVERCIALCPAQYLWDYKRFSTQEDGTRRSYR